MDAINGALTALFDLLLIPLEAVGKEFALIVVSGVFGILALIVFKHISWQRGIKAVKDKIKGHMIEIRLYQNDLVLVSKAIAKVLWRNLQYVSLNFGPFIPLAVPFAFVVAQMVVRYSFEPTGVHAEPAALLAGAGTTVRIEMAPGHEQEVADLELLLPEGVTAVSPLVPVPSQGYAFQEIVAERDGSFELTVVAGGERLVKLFHAGDVEPRHLQGRRTDSALVALLWPAERTLPEASGVASIELKCVGQGEGYPESELGWLPGSGPVGVILVFLVVSMAFGFAALKPLGVQI